MHPSHAVPEGISPGSRLGTHTHPRTHAHTLRFAASDANVPETREMRFPLISSRTVPRTRTTTRCMRPCHGAACLCDDIVMDRSLCPRARRVLICAGRNSLSHISFFMQPGYSPRRRDSPYIAWNLHLINTHALTVTVCTAA